MTNGMEAYIKEIDSKILDSKPKDYREEDGFDKQVGKSYNTKEEAE